jgi:hypothetical protein
MMTMSMPSEGSSSVTCALSMNNVDDSPSVVDYVSVGTGGGGGGLSLAVGIGVGTSTQCSGAGPLHAAGSPLTSQGQGQGGISNGPLMVNGSTTVPALNNNIPGGLLVNGTKDVGVGSNTSFTVS